PAAAGQRGSREADEPGEGDQQREDDGGGDAAEPKEGQPAGDGPVRGALVPGAGAGPRSGIGAGAEGVEVQSAGEDERPVAGDDHERESEKGRRKTEGGVNEFSHGNARFRRWTSETAPGAMKTRRPVKKDPLCEAGDAAQLSGKSCAQAMAIMPYGGTQTRWDGCGGMNACRGFIRPPHDRSGKEHRRPDFPAHR